MARDSHFTPQVALRPRLPSQHVWRSALVGSLLNRLSEMQLACIHAPAGYGKSVLIAECLEHAPYDSVYLRFEPQSAAPLMGPEAHIQQVAAGSGVAQRVAEALSAIQNPDSAYGALLSALTEHSGPLLLVFDDIPRQTDESDLARFGRFLDNLPSAWRVILSSRGRPGLPLARWLAQERLTVYGPKHLELSTEEVKHLLGRIPGRGFAPAEVALVGHTFRGWIAGLVLAVNAYRSRCADDFVQLLKVHGGVTREIEAYLQQEVVQLQLTSTELHDFAYRTSVLFELPVDICNEFLTISNAGQLLHTLEQRDVFITSLDDAGTIYEYLPVFKQFLQVELHRTLGMAGVERLHVQAAQIYEQRGMWEPSIRHYLSAHDSEKAADIIEREGQAILDRPSEQSHTPWLHSRQSDEPLDTLRGWLAALPPAVLDTRPLLLAHQAHISRLRHDHAQARVLVEKAMARLSARPDPLVEARVVSEWAAVAALEGRPQEAILRLQETLTSLDIEPAVKADVYLGVAATRAAIDDLGSAVKAGEEALVMASLVADKNVRLGLEMRIARCLSELYCDQGELRQALPMADRAYTISASSRIGGLYAHILNIKTRMSTLIALGDFDASRQMGAEWANLAQASDIELPDRQHLATMLGWVAYVEQDYELADSYFRSVVPVPLGLSVVRGLQGQGAEALRLAHIASESFSVGASPRTEHFAQVFLGVAEGQFGDNRQARQLIEQAVNYFEDTGLNYFCAGARLHLAWLLRRHGDSESALTHLAAAFDYAAETETRNLAFWHPDVFASSCAAALREERHTAYIADLVIHRFTSAQARYFRPLLHHSSGDTRRHVAAILRALASAPGAKAPAEIALPHMDEVIENLIKADRLTREGAIKLASTYRLPPREIEVFLLYIDPDTRVGEQQLNKAIADRLFLSPASVRNYISTILRKLNASGRDRLRLHRWAISEGIIPE